MKLLHLFAALLRWVGGVVAPMVLRPTAPAALAWFCHLVLVLGVAAGLYFLRQRLGPAFLSLPNRLDPYWLSGLFLLGYLLLWAAAWLWELLRPNAPAGDFPDLDDAWRQALDTLAKAGIDVAQTPLYLVFGEWACGYEPIFRALPNGLTVAGGTAPSAPLRVFANRDGVYLALPGASLLGFRGQLNDYVGQDVGGVDAGSIAVARGAGGGGGAGAYRSIGLGASLGGGGSVGAGSVGGSFGAAGPLKEVQRIIRQAKDEDRPLTVAERQRVRELSGADGGAGPGRAPAGAAGSVLQNPDLAAELAARLIHVCGLVARARWPLCPINGAVIAVPFAATERDEVAQQWGLVAQEDAAIAEAVLQLHYPLYALVGGVEDLPGGAEFFERFAAEKSGQRLGKGFPLNPDLAAGQTRAAVEGNVRWVFEGLLPYWATRLMRLDAEPAQDVKANTGLVRFLAESRRRAASIAQLVGRAVIFEEGRPPLFGGCYLAVVLPGRPAEAHFAREFLAKVHQTRSFVRWTEAAFRGEAWYRSRALLGNLLTALVVAAVAGLAAFVAYTKYGLGR